MIQLYLAIKVVFTSKKLLLIFFTTSFVFFSLFILIPVITIPSNSLSFQLSIFRTQDYILMVSLALLVGISLALQIFIWQQNKLAGLSQSIVRGTTSGVAGIFGAVVGTAACASCLASLFGLIGLGTGSVFFVLKNQPYFLIGAIGLMLISLYFSAKRVNKVCSSC